MFLTLLPEALRSLFLNIGADASLAQKVDQIRMPIYGILLVVLMLVRPQGLFGTREIWDVLPRWWPRDAEGADVSGEVLLQVVKAGIEFGGLRALHGFDLGGPPGRPEGAHRPERRREDHRLQRPHRRLRAHPRGRSASAASG